MCYKHLTLSFSLAASFWCLASSLNASRPMQLQMHSSTTYFLLRLQQGVCGSPQIIVGRLHGQTRTSHSL